jgi:hypothetical protein
MKKLLLIAVFLLAVDLAFGQPLQKGNLVGLHMLTINLAPGVTIEQYKSFYTSKVIPEYEKYFQGAKGYLVKSIRGEQQNTFGIIWIFASEQDRDKYFNSDGTQNDMGKAAVAKIDPVEKELNKLGTTSSKYTDWVVQ